MAMADIPSWKDDAELLRPLYVRSISVSGEVSEASTKHESKIASRLEARLAGGSDGLRLSGGFLRQSLPYLQTEEGQIVMFDAVKNVKLPAVELKSAGNSHLAAWLPLPLRHRKTDDRSNSSSLQPEYALPPLRRCAACAGIFEFPLQDGGSVHFWCGYPGLRRYTAVSYLWHTVVDVWSQCSNCKHRTVFPMHSVAKFHDILRLAGGGAYVWLDALSIDQDDPNDVQKQIKAMGSIYRRAAQVSVLLPPNDAHVHDLLEALVPAAKYILHRSAHFFHNRDQEAGLSELGLRESGEAHLKAAEILPKPLFPHQKLAPHYGNGNIGDVCKAFVGDVRRFSEIVQRAEYWSRAWTFQEWTVAEDINVGVEGVPAKSSLFCVKTSIFSAASLLSQYKMFHTQYTEIDTGLNRHTVPPWFARVRSVFPIEDAILAPSELDRSAVDFQTQFSSFANDQLLRLATKPRDAPQKIAHARLQLALDSFGASNRTATHVADLVACWASMCDLEYSYSRNDTLLSAVTKVKGAVRTRGFTVFDFAPTWLEPSTHDHMPSKRPSFFAFAKPQTVCNARQYDAGSAIAFDGLPLLTGRSDAKQHLQAILSLDYAKHDSAACTEDLTLREVKGAYMDATPTHDFNAVTFQLAETIYGDLDAARIGTTAFFNPLTPILASVMRDTSHPADLHFCQIRIPAVVDAQSATEATEKWIRAWAICPLSASEMRRLTIARESLNGTFVLVLKQSGSHSVLAYITVTDIQSGTLLLRSDEKGMIDMVFDSPKSSAMMAGFGGGRMLTDDRRLQGRVSLTELPM